MLISFGAVASGGRAAVVALLAAAVAGALLAFLYCPRLVMGAVLGLFSGVCLEYRSHSAHLTVHRKAFAERNDVVVAYERIKEDIRARTERARGKYHFFRPFHSDTSLSEVLKDLRESFESRIRK